MKMGPAWPAETAFCTKPTPFAMSFAISPTFEVCEVAAGDGVGDVALAGVELLEQLKLIAISQNEIAISENLFVRL
jgi:hypothetical protein